MYSPVVVHTHHPVKCDGTTNIQFMVYIHVHVLIHDICSTVLMFSFCLSLVLLRSLRPPAHPLEYINTQATNATYSMPQLLPVLHLFEIIIIIMASNDETLA